MTQTAYLGNIKVPGGEISRAKTQEDYQYDSRIDNLQKFHDVTFIIPTKNEERNLPHVLPMIPSEAEVILVDGHSTDNTIDVARMLRHDIRVFYQTGRGKGDAMRYGFSLATRDIVITYDADGSFSHKEIARFVSPLREGMTW